MYALLVPQMYIFRARFTHPGIDISYKRSKDNDFMLIAVYIMNVDLIVSTTIACSVIYHFYWNRTSSEINSSFACLAISPLEYAVRDTLVDRCACLILNTKPPGYY